MNKKVLSGILACGMVLSMTVGSVPAMAEEGGRELKIGVTTAPQNVSPFTNFTNRQPVVHYLYETLVEKDAEGNFVGILAKDWSTEDNITYSFEIYDYIKDSEGNAITAEDCVFSLEHARDEAANTWISSAEVTGDYTFNVTLTDDSVSTFPTAMSPWRESSPDACGSPIRSRPSC